MTSKNREVPGCVVSKQCLKIDPTRRTRVALPVKVVTWIAVTSESQSGLLASRTMSERDVPVGNVVEEMNVALVQQESSCNGVNWGIAPSFIKEATVTVKRFEEVNVRLASEPVQIADLEVGPKMAVVVCFSAIVTEEAHSVIRSKVFGMVLHKLLGAVPKSLDGLCVFVQAENEAILLATFMHDAERVIVDVAVQFNRWLNTPVVIVVHHKGLSKEETGFKSAHVAVAHGITIDDLALSHVLAHFLGLVLVDPLGE